VAGFSGDGGPATSARLNGPYGLSVDGEGNLFIADYDNDRIRQVSPEGIIRTVAGTGVNGFSGDGGPATSAQIASPWGVTADGQGNLFIADAGNSRIRQVSPDGIIRTIAGTGTQSSCGDGGPATAACIGWPARVAVDAQGNLFIPDYLNNRIRQVSPGGIISTVAGVGPFGEGAGGSSGDGGPATAAQLNGPLAVALDAQGNLFIPEYFSHRVRLVTAQGLIRTVAGTGAPRRAPSSTILAPWPWIPRGTSTSPMAVTGASGSSHPGSPASGARTSPCRVRTGASSTSSRPRAGTSRRAMPSPAPSAPSSATTRQAG
jgi:hypothetical protein